MAPRTAARHWYSVHELQIAQVPTSSCTPSPRGLTWVYEATLWDPERTQNMPPLPVSATLQGASFNRAEATSLQLKTRIKEGNIAETGTAWGKEASMGGQFTHYIHSAKSHYLAQHSRSWSTACAQ